MTAKAEIVVEFTDGKGRPAIITDDGTQWILRLNPGTPKLTAYCRTRDGLLRMLREVYSNRVTQSATDFGRLGDDVVKAVRSLPERHA